LGQATGIDKPFLNTNIYFFNYKTFFQELSGPMAETLRRELINQMQKCATGENLGKLSGGEDSNFN